MTDIDPAIHPGQFRLARLQVVNWGTFHGYQDLPIARKGFLLTGASGSGKSTLIDAISAVLMSAGAARFNAAAQESKSGRNLVSYVRGAWRKEAGVDVDGLVSTYRRPGATWSGIALTYRRGDEGDPSAAPVTLIKLMHIARGSNLAADIKTVHVIVDADIELLDVEPFAHHGLDSRGIRRHWPDALVNPSYSPFAAAFRKRLGIGSESAQHLLHRTLSAKSLGSLDQLFRDYMLDRPPTFDRAERAVEQFRDLHEAHRVVVDARLQVQTLAPLTELAEARTDGLRLAAHLEADNEHLDAVHAELKLDVLGSALADERARTPLLAAALDARSQDAKQALDRVIDLQVKVASAGEGRLELLRSELRNAESDAARITRDHAKAAAAVEVWNGVMATTAEEYANIQGQLTAALREATAATARRTDRLYTTHAEKKEVQDRLEGVVADRETLARRRSNLDTDLLRARELVCRATGIDEADLPFGGELIAVSADHADWTGPIERVLSGFGRTMIVPADVYPQVAAAVDATQLRTRLTYLRVRTASDAATRRTGPLSVVRKLEVKAGSLEAWTHRHLAEHFDFACVADARELSEHVRAVTRAGQVKRSGDRHEKDDRRPIDDRTRWVLGFDNERKLDDLRKQEAQCRARLLDIDRVLAGIDDETRNQNARETAARDIRALNWKDIDVAAAGAAITALEIRISSWQQENPEHAALTRALELADKEESEARIAEGDARAAVAGNRDRIAERERQISQIETSATTVPDDIRQRVHTRFRSAARSVTADNIDELLNRIRKDITSAARQTSTANQKIDNKITTILTTYLSDWSHARGDLRREPEYVGDALDVLARLRRDGLPQFEAKFFDLLNEQSTRNLAELTRVINRAPADIRARIDPVNDSLRRSPFDVGRILRIDVRDRRPQSATEFLADLKSITSRSLVEDDRIAAEQRYEKMAALLTRLGSGEPADRSWQRQVLDTRLHVGFIGVEVDDEGVDVNYHDSSAGLSGGQAQKLVFFCLAAALRYQLAGDGADIPTYGSIVLDEAFDKADPQYTRRALDVFRQFGFHMILATPLKLLSTLEEYIGGVATVTIKDGKASHVGLIPIQTARPTREGTDA